VFGSIVECSGDLFPATQLPRALCRLAAAAAAAEAKSALFKCTYTSRAHARAIILAPQLTPQQMDEAVEFRALAKSDGDAGACASVNVPFVD
jgi:hypothetical protein